MRTTDYSTSVPYREVTDRNGRVYRVGESDIDIMGRRRTWMVILPWVGMMGISSAEYAFTSAEDALHQAHLWSSGHIFWLVGVWVFFQAAVAVQGSAAELVARARRPAHGDPRPRDPAGAGEEPAGGEAVHPEGGGPYPCSVDDVV